MTQVSFENCPPFTKCVTKIDGAIIIDVEDLDLSHVNVQSNTIKYYLIQSNYSETTLSLWFWSKDKATNFDADIEKTNN